MRSKLLTLTTALFAQLTPFTNSKPVTNFPDDEQNINNDENGDFVTISGSDNNVTISDNSNTNWEPAIQNMNTSYWNRLTFSNSNGDDYQDNSYNGQHVDVNGQGNDVDLDHRDYSDNDYGSYNSSQELEQDSSPFANREQRYQQQQDDMRETLPIYESFNVTIPTPICLGKNTSSCGTPDVKINVTNNWQANHNMTSNWSIKNSINSTDMPMMTTTISDYNQAYDYEGPASLTEEDYENSTQIKQDIDYAYQHNHNASIIDKDDIPTAAPEWYSGDVTWTTTMEMETELELNRTKIYNDIMSIANFSDNSISNDNGIATPAPICLGDDCVNSQTNYNSTSNNDDDYSDYNQAIDNEGNGARRRRELSEKMMNWNKTEIKQKIYNDIMSIANFSNNAITNDNDIATPASICLNDACVNNTINYNSTNDYSDYNQAIDEEGNGARRRRRDIEESVSKMSWNKTEIKQKIYNDIMSIANFSQNSISDDNDLTTPKPICLENCVNSTTNTNSTDNDYYSEYNQSIDEEGNGARKKRDSHHFQMMYNLDNQTGTDDYLAMFFIRPKT